VVKKPNQLIKHQRTLQETVDAMDAATLVGHVNQLMIPPEGTPIQDLRRFIESVLHSVRYGNEQILFARNNIKDAKTALDGAISHIIDVDERIQRIEFLIKEREPDSDYEDVINRYDDEQERSESIAVEDYETSEYAPSVDESQEEDNG